jgi:hypothetical protein
MKPVFNDVIEMIGGLIKDGKKKKKRTYVPSRYSKLGEIQPARVQLRAPLAPLAPIAPAAAPAAPVRRGRPAGQPKRRRRTKAEIEFAKLNKMADSIAKREAKEAKEAELAESAKALKGSPKKAKPKTRAQTEAERAALERAEWEAFVPEGSPSKLKKLREIEARLLGSPEPPKAPKTPAAKAAKAEKAKPKAETKTEEIGAGRLLGRFN